MNDNTDHDDHAWYAPSSTYCSYCLGDGSTLKSPAVPALTFLNTPHSRTPPQRATPPRPFTMSSSCSSTPRPSREHSSRFKEHLSIYVPPANYPIEASRFSPESPPEPSRTLSSWTNASTVRSSTPIRKDMKEMDTGSLPSVPSFTSRTSRMGRLFFDIRTLVRDREPEVVPIQQPDLPPWAPLHIEKRTQCCHDCPCHSVSKKDRRRRRILIIVLVLVILYLLGNTVVLNTRVFAPQPAVQVSPNITSSSSSSLSAVAQQCLSQYTVNAPSDPSGYPCSQCLPTLQAVPSDFSDGTAQDSQQILNAVQFCGLRSIFETSDSNGQSALKNGNWAQDVKFCAWTGVSCDGMGRVSSL